ncbi:2599_t:CDS:2, partial [Acaulospora morrowiae]
MKDTSIVLRVVLEGILVIGPNPVKIVDSSETFLQLFNRVIRDSRPYSIVKILARQSSSHNWYPVKEPFWDFLQHPYWRPVFTVWIHLIQTGRREICFTISRSKSADENEDGSKKVIENILNQKFVYLENAMNKKGPYIKVNSVGGQKRVAKDLRKERQNKRIGYSERMGCSINQAVVKENDDVEKVHHIWYGDLRL